MDEWAGREKCEEWNHSNHKELVRRKTKRERRRVFLGRVNAHIFSRFIVFFSLCIVYATCCAYLCYLSHWSYLFPLLWLSALSLKRILSRHLSASLSLSPSLCENGRESVRTHLDSVVKLRELHGYHVLLSSLFYRVSRYSVISHLMSVSFIREGNNIPHIDSIDRSKESRSSHQWLLPLLPLHPKEEDAVVEQGGHWERCSDSSLRER